MKTQVLIWITVVGLMMTACRNDAPSITDSDINREQDALVVEKIIKAGYVPMVDEQYVLTMTEQEALKLGITHATYQRFCVEVVKMNTMLQELLEKGRQDPTTVGPVTVHDGTNFDYSDSAVRDRQTRAYPSGVINTNDQYERQATCYAPSMMKFPDCHCYAFLTCGHVVTAITRGVRSSESRWSSGKVKVGLKYTDNDCIVAYHTTDSNGGSCSWKGVEN